MQNRAFSILACLLIPVVVFDQAFGSRDLRSPHVSNALSGMRFATEAVNAPALAARFAPRQHTFYSFLVAVGLVVSASLASGQTIPPQAPAAPPQKVEFDFSLRDVFNPKLPGNKMLERIAQVLWEINRQKLSRPEAGARMKLPAQSRRIYEKYGIVALGSDVTKQAAMTALAPLLDLLPPDQASALRFWIAPHVDQIPPDDQINVGAQYYPDHKGIVFINQDDSETWAHEYGHHLILPRQSNSKGETSLPSQNGRRSDAGHFRLRSDGRSQGEGESDRDRQSVFC